MLNNLDYYFDIVKSSGTKHDKQSSKGKNVLNIYLLPTNRYYSNGN